MEGTAMNRREMLLHGLAAPWVRTAYAATDFDLRAAPARIVPAADGVRLERHWSGDFCQSRLVNRGKQPVRIKEVVLFSVSHNLPSETRLYGESFQMLSQTSG